MRWQVIRDTALQDASELARRMQRPNGLRANLVASAKSVSIDRIEEHDIATTALLVRRPDGRYTLFLTPGQPVTRQRFSIAHELAHVLLSQHLGGAVHCWSRLDPSQDPQGQRAEYLCDQMAAEILMPGKVFGEWMARHQWTAVALPEASRDFSVSLEAASRRFVELLPEQCILIRWKLNGTSSAVMTETPIAPQVKYLRGLEFVTDGKQPSREMQATYKNGGHATTREIVRLFVGRAIQSKQCLVESICHGNGQWREVYSFVYPEQRSGAGREGIIT